MVLGWEVTGDLRRKV